MEAWEHSNKGLRAHARYQATSVSGFEPITIPEQVGIGIKRGGASDSQVKFLVRLGVPEAKACSYTKGQAGAVIDKLDKASGGEFRVRFGKYLGRKLSEVPEKWLQWGETHCDDWRLRAEIANLRREQGYAE